MDNQAVLGRNAQVGLWIAIALALRALLAAFIAPVSALFPWIQYAAIAWGIRRKWPGAALACAATLVVTAAFYAIPGTGEFQFARVVAGLFVGAAGLLFAWLEFRAFLELRRGPGSPWTGWLFVVFPALSAFYLVSCSSLLVPSDSMAPTVLIGDCVIVDRLHTVMGREPQRDELAIFHYPLQHEQVYLKRVVGVAGDKLHLVHKKLYRNGKEVVEPYVRHGSSFEDTYRDNFPGDPNIPLSPPAMRMIEAARSSHEVTVPPGKYFVLGDNRDDSSDSRYWGFVDRSEIIGRPVLIYDSYDSSKGQLHTIRDTRWSRLLKLLQ